MDNPLSTKAVLVSLNISQWSARRLDKKVTQETNEAHNAVADAGRYNKLLVKKEALEPIGVAVTAARTYHIVMTQPWTDNGPRLLPSKLVIQYQTKMRQLRQEFDRVVEEFSLNYPRYVDERRRELNGMFRASDYPGTREIRDRFGFGIEMYTVPDVSDFRVAISKEYADDLRAHIEQSTHKALAKAMRDSNERILETVGRMAERLKNFKPKHVGEDGKLVAAENRFRDSLVENVRELADLLPAFNLTDDEMLARIAKQIKSELCEYDAEILRENDGTRLQVAASAERILREVKDFMA